MNNVICSIVICVTRSLMTARRIPIWWDVISERDKQVYENAGFGGRRPFGKRPVTIVIDVTYAFVGDKPEPILKSIERFPNSCGEEGWSAVQNIKKLIDDARAHDIPVIYTRPAGGARVAVAKQGKGDFAGGSRMIPAKTAEIVREIAPKKSDIVIRKERPSAFFGTYLASYLVNLRADTLVVAGCTTSGCVRATVLDGFQYGFGIFVVEECVFDRGQVSHKVNLFDMNAKYADVVSLQTALEYMSRGAQSETHLER